MTLFSEMVRHLTIATVSYLLFTKIKPMNFAFFKKVLLCTGFIVFSTSIFALLTHIFNLSEPFRTAIVVLAFGIIFALILRERLEIMITAITIAFAASCI